MHQMDHPAQARLTYLSRLHPYPAMVADELALDLASEYIPTAGSILDPFCGSGRLLAAANCASVRVGVDFEPIGLASNSREAIFRPDESHWRDPGDFSRVRKVRPTRLLKTSVHGSIDWFAPDIVRDLERVIAWLNGLWLAEFELFLAASALSATVREVSFARQNGWKLHRLSAEKRAVFKASVFDRFERRLRYCEKELTGSHLGGGISEVHLGDARSLTDIVAERYRRFFDVIMTSPPYGDSRTTVQYGAASALCLSVVSRLCGLEHLGMLGREIDGVCLGSPSERRFLQNRAAESFKFYWAGSVRSPSYRRVATFLLDYRKVCAGIIEMLKPGGKAILVVGRRSTGGFRLKLDDFTVDELERGGLTLVKRYERVLQQKRFPKVINRFGRSSDETIRSRGRLTTMSNEIILVFQKLAHAGESQ